MIGSCRFITTEQSHRDFYSLYESISRIVIWRWLQAAEAEAQRIKEEAQREADAAAQKVNIHCDVVFSLRLCDTD